MEYSIRPSENRDFILLTLVGDFTAKSMMTCIVETHILGQRLRVHRYLVDSLEARNVDSVLGNYTFAYVDMKITEGIDPQAVVAVVARPEDHSHDFVETVASNAGMTMKVFNDRAAAEEFLRKA